MNYESKDLFEHADFARRLAIGLAGDPHRADDLVQDAWADVLTSPPADGRSPRGFLATVLRRAAARSVRNDQRRGRRERIAARPEELPSTADIASRLEMHRHIVQAVAQLAPAYRQVIVLRFFDGLTPAEIAARSMEPVETVRTRMKRALTQLRTRLDVEYGSRSAWVSVVVPAAAIGSATASVPVLFWTVVIMSRVKFGVAVVLLSSIGVWAVWSNGEGSAVDYGPAEPVVQNAEVPSGAPEESSGDVAGGRVELASGVSITGHVTAIDVDGGEHPAADGTIVVRIGERVHRIAVTAGQFRVELEHAQSLQVRSVTLAGRLARVEEPELAFSPTLELRARWFAEAGLRVVDAVTRRDLIGVQILKGVTVFRGRVHPGTWKPENVVVSGAESPLALPGGEGVAEYWVRAEGYAWEAVEIELSKGGRRIVALQREAAITVHLDRYDPDWNLFVRLYAPDARPFGPCLAEGVSLHTQAGATAVVIHGLRAGAVRVEAQFGHWSDPPRMVAQSRATLVVGAVTNVWLALDPEKLPGKPVELAGTMQLSGGLEDLNFTLGLHRVYGPPMRKGDRRMIRSDGLRHEKGSSVFRWDFGTVSPGRYVITVAPLQFVHELEVTNRPQRDVRIVLPELAQVLVTLTDVDADAPAEVQAISWGRSTPSGMRTWSYENARFDAELGGYAFRAPLGKFVIQMRSDRYAEVSRRVQIVSGANTVKIRTRELPYCWVELEDGHTLIPISWTSLPTVQRGEKTPRTGRGRVRAIEGGRAKVVVTEPGDYRLVFSALDGYEAIPPRLVTFVRGREERVVIDLMKSR